ncbi:MAG: aldo/keto reductase [Victivallaceae bacterium]|jgi:diketogulonate reductase-like aldo/keto reductase
MITIKNKELKCGLRMPVFGMGTWMMGGNSERDAGNNGDADTAALIAGFERGLTHIDTAEMYAGGFAEEIVGRAIAGRKRSNLFITSKVWNTNLSYDGVLRAAESSLKRLGTDYLDLYLVHKPNDDIPLKDTIRALDRLQDEKIIRNIGVSNFSVKRLDHAQALSGHKIVANQAHYNLIFREPEVSGLLDYCGQNDVMLIAWRPLQKGGLTASGGEFLKPLCEKYGKTPYQLMLNWLISQPGVATISTMRTLRHLDENLEAVEWKMAKEDIEFIRKKFPEQQSVSEVPLS